MLSNYRFSTMRKNPDNTFLFRIPLTDCRAHYDKIMYIFNDIEISVIKIFEIQKQIRTPLCSTGTTRNNVNFQKPVTKMLSFYF